VNHQAASFGDFAPFVTIHITDNGVGMSPEVAARAVEPFYTTKEQGKGTGLGLAQVYGFIQQCKGDFRIISRVGLGTTVDLLLRQTFVPFSALAPPSLIPSEPSDKQNLTAPLLLVDDDELVRTAMAEALRCSGFVVVEADGGAHALDMLVELRPCVAIIDYLMPGMNGAEVAQRARAIFPDLPIIFVSGYADTAALERVVGAAIFRKPVPIEALITAIGELTVNV
jgi:CheY-like chemotaxis protein